MFLTEKVKVTDINIGDLLKSRDISSNKDRYRLVTNTMTPIVNDQIEINSGLYSVCTSMTHPMAIVKNEIEQYVDSQDVKVRDLIVTPEGYKRVTSITKGKKYSPEFIDFTIDEDNNYYAGNRSDKLVLAHNSATLFFPLWTYEISSLMSLKNSKLTEDNSARHLDYCVQFSRIFYKRFVSDGDITLFNPNEVPDLYEAFFKDEVLFDSLYEQYENDESIKMKKIIKASELFGEYCLEKSTTSRIYLQNVHHCNQNSPFISEVAPIKQSNLCLAKGTMVLVASGKKYETIEDLAEFSGGKKLINVYCSNTEISEKKGREWKEWKTTIATGTAFKSGEKQVIKLKFDNGGYLKCTPDHKLALVNGNWVEAKDSIGKKLQSTEGKLSVETIQTCGIEEVYDLTVPSTENFYIQLDGTNPRNLLVHNCLEIVLPTSPVSLENNEEGEISLCTLGGINLGKIESYEGLEIPCRSLVRFLDNVLDYQEYPVLVAEKSTKSRRPLGIGVINYAYYLAKNNSGYTDERGIQITHELFESIQYYCLKESVELAKERGRCSKFDETTYSQGVLPIDRYCKGIDQFSDFDYIHDWRWLGEEIKTHGLRNSTLTTQFPAEASSRTSNGTNGIEPPKSFISTKWAKDGMAKQVVPGFKDERIRDNYELLWDIPDNIGYLKRVAVMQKFVDQSISANLRYDPNKFKDGKVPFTTMMKDLLIADKYGIKTIYYHLTRDDEEETREKGLELSEMESDGCEGGSCSL